jgi:hypothetical protein
VNGDAPQVLYRCYGPDEALLYVGITLDPAARLTTHNREKAWWSEVATIELEHFDSREAVEKAECVAIAQERPKYNVVHSLTAGPLTRISVDTEVRPRDLAALELRQMGRSWSEIRSELRVSHKTVKKVALRLQRAGLVSPGRQPRPTDIPAQTEPVGPFSRHQAP